MAEGDAVRDHDAPADAAAASVVWRSLGSWSGVGSRQTESFDVTSGALRLDWETTADGTAEPGRLRVALHSAISGRVVEEVVDASGNASGTAHFTSEPRVAYLRIESERVGWRLTLEEGLPGQ